MPNEFVVKNGLIAQNNSIVSGSLIVTNGITGSLFGTSSQAVSASFTATASYGFFVVSASYAFTASSATNAFQAVSSSYAFTASSATNSTNALTASSADNFVVRQSLTASNALVNGRLTAQTLVVSTISSSVVYSSGSNIFGSNLTDVQQMTGSLRVTGSGNHWILGGNVGIGTNAPSEALHIIKNGDFQIRLQNNNAGGGCWNIGQTDNTFNAGGGKLIFTPNSDDSANSTVTFTCTGNVGIGTNFPSARLTVSGSNTSCLLLVGSPSAASALFVSGSGNVGIGTTSPLQKLHVFGTADSTKARFELLGTAGINEVLQVVNRANWSSGRGVKIGLYVNSGSNETQIGAEIGAVTIGTDQLGSDLFFNVASASVATERMRITSCGNVGIGTASPSSILTISGSNTSCLLLVGSPGASSALFVSGSGNVGIGTTNPSSTLDVRVSRTNGTNVNVISLSDNLTGASTSGFGTRIQGLSNGNSVVSAIGFENGGTGTNNESQISFYTQNVANALTRQMVVSSTGNVGIGTSSPSARLTVSGSNTSCLLLVGSPGAASALFVSGSGNVGIGTTSIPNALGNALQLGGSTTFMSYVNNSYFLNNWYYDASGNARYIGAATSSGYIQDSSGNHKWFSNPSGTANATFTPIEYMRLTSAGNVGIGTTSPSSILTVSGSNTSCLLLVGSPGASSALFVSGSGNVGIGTTTPTTLLDVLGGTFTVRGTQTSFSILSNYAGQGDIPAGTLISLGCVVNNNLGIIPNGNGIANSKITAAAYNGTAWRSMWEFCNVSSGNPNLLLVKSGGSVGIGTTTPSTLLDVSGSGRYTNGLSLTGSVNSLNGYTGSLFGTASQAVSASFAQFAFSASFAPGFSVSMSQLTPATTWSFTHNLNSRNPIVQVYDTTFAQIIPNQIVGINNSLAEIRFDYAEAGYAVASNGGGLYVTGSTSLLNQTSAAVTWSFTHNLNSKYVAFEIYDSNDNVIIPSNIRVINENSAEIHLSTAITGRAVAQFSGISGTPNAFTASYALTASFVPNLNQNVFITGSLRTTGSVSITGSFAQTSGYMVLSQVSQSLNYADDTAAAAAGVPLGGIYRNGNFILIRLS